MRRSPVILAGVLFASPAAVAQVTMNNGALDALGKPDAPAAHHAPVRRHPVARPTRHQAPPHPAAAPAAEPHAEAPAAPAKPQKPAIPAAPPAILALPPAVAVPLAHPPPPPTIPVAADAPGTAIPLQGGGLRITFGADRADLNPATVAALRQFAAGMADKPTTSISILAYAAGSPDDPSTPRRLALERALAARAVLLDAGIPSPRIYPRALGPIGGSTDPDRIDVMAGAPTPTNAAGHAG